MHRTLVGVLAEQNRMNIVELLRDGPLTVGEIARRLGMRQPQASKHLKVLAENGVLQVKAEANRRYYGLRPEPFRALYAWLRSLHVMEERYDKLEDLLSELQGSRITTRTGKIDKQRPEVN